VGQLAARLAQNLGLPEQQVDLIRLAAPLHDLGKIGIPDHILLKPGRFMPKEYEQMKSHVAIGARILSGGRYPLLLMAEEIAYTHHERWDGSGYPLGLAGEDIPLTGRIVAVADTFDALTHARPYKHAWPIADALREIARQSGEKFDPCVVATLVRLFEQEGAAEQPADLLLAIETPVQPVALGDQAVLEHLS
jgi:putative two-component system response regulator